MPKLRLRREGQPPLEVPEPRAVLGRDRGCELVVEDRSISRRHVAFELRGGDWTLVDLGSANGTFVDERRVAEAALADGQTVRAGSLTLRVEIEPDVAATVLIQVPEVDGAATVVMASPEAPPLVGTVQIQVPSLAPPVVRPPAPRPPAPPVPAARPSAAPARPGPVAPPPPAPRPAGDDPWQLIGLAPGAPADEVRARCDEAARDLRQKAASAPTAALRATYERNLAALERARRTLLPGAAADLLRDLPAAQPTVDADSLEQSASLRAAAPEPPPPVGEAAPAKGRATLLPLATTVLVFAAAGLLALCAYFALASSKLRAQIHKQEAAPELVAARQEDARYEPFAALLESGALRNGRLRLCNRSSRPLEVSWLAAVSVQKEALPAEADAALAAKADGFKLVTYNSGFCGRDFRISLAPGAERSVDLPSEEPRCRFDGRAVFYALSLQRPAAEPAAAEAPPPAKPGRAAAPAAAPTEERPGDPGTTYWQAGLLGGKDECVGVGAGW